MSFFKIVLEPFLRTFKRMHFLALVPDAKIAKAQEETHSHA